MRRTLFLIALIVVVVAVNYSYGQGCSQCKLLAEQGSELDEDTFGNNINSGILYLMAIPYVLLFLFFRKRIFSFFRQLKKA